MQARPAVLARYLGFAPRTSCPLCRQGVASNQSGTEAILAKRLYYCDEWLHFCLLDGRWDQPKRKAMVNSSVLTVCQTRPPWPAHAYGLVCHWSGPCTSTQTRCSIPVYCSGRVCLRCSSGADSPIRPCVTLLTFLHGGAGRLQDPALQGVHCTELNYDESFACCPMGAPIQSPACGLWQVAWCWKCARHAAISALTDWAGWQARASRCGHSHARPS